MANGPFLWDFSGLVTSPGRFARPGASCTSLINLRIPSKGLLEKRIGFTIFAENAGGAIWGAYTSRLLNADVLLHVGDGTEGVYVAKFDGTVPPTALTNCDGQDVTRAANPRLHMMAAETAHYVTSEEGVRRIESTFNQVRAAGMPSGMPPDTLNNLRFGETSTDLASGTATGTLTASAGPVYTDGGQSWTTNDLAGKYLVMTSGAANGLAVVIASNTGTAITGTTSFTIAPGIADTYAIQEVFRVLNTSPAGPLTDGGAAAYRVTWHRKAQDEKTILGGPPTGRVVIRNSAGTSGYDGPSASVSCRIPVPCELNTPYGFAANGVSPCPITGTYPAFATPPVTAYPTQSEAGQLTVDYFYRLWRSFIVDAGSPSDEMYLIAETYLTAEDIARGYCLFNDATPDSYLRGAPKLNTNAINFPAVGEAGIKNGIVNADTAPPACVDAGLFSGCAWYGNTTTRAALSTTLLAYGANGFNVGDAITVNGIVMTGVAEPAQPPLLGPFNVALNPYEFIVSTSLATLALNIEATARNLVESYNRQQRPDPLYAYYISLGTQLPGQIYWEMNAFRYINGSGAESSEFVITSDSGDAWRPDLTVSAEGLKTTATNALWFSKQDRPDSVPVVNQFMVGPSDSRILRVIPFRDRLYVFTDNGLYQVTGNFYGNFSLQLVDATARLFSPESVAVVEDAVYAWLVEGMAEINEAGVLVISDLIDITVNNLITDFTRQNMKDYGFAIGYRLAHRVQFFYWAADAGESGPFCNKWFEFDVRTRTWSTGLFNNDDLLTPKEQGKSHGVVRFSDDNLLLTTWNSGGSDGFLFIETPGTYTDDSVSGDAILMSTNAAFQVQTPDTEGAVHWQQLVIHFNSSLDPERLWPVFFAVYFSADDTQAGSLIQAFATSITGPTIRIETPAVLRRNSRMQIQVGSMSSDYYWGLAGVQMNFRGGTRFAIKTTGNT